MREYIYSLATLTGFIGLASLYQHGQNFGTPARIVKREAEFSAINETDDASELLDSEELMAEDFDFLKELGYFEEGADIPDDMVEVFEDVKQYQENADPQERRAGGRDTIRAVMKCMKSKKCRNRASDTIYSWGRDLNTWVLSNSEEYMRPVTTETRIEDPETSETGLSLCTPKDDVIPCSELSADFQDSLSDEGKAALGDLAGATNGYSSSETNTDPASGFTKNNAILERIGNYQNGAGDEVGSESLDFMFDKPAGQISGISDENNVFSLWQTGKVRLFFIQPNGIPMHMAQSRAGRLDYKNTFKYYWNWFKELNSKYIGIGPANRSNPRSNFMVWFLRQDKNIKPMSKNPAKARAFPMNKMETMMTKPQATAAQPQFLPTYTAIYNQIDAKNYGASMESGDDCIVIWIHHFVPSDIENLTDENNQENFIAPLDFMCQIIHIWVGFEGNQQAPAKNAIRYIQGILQPTQLKNTAEDPNLRGYHFVDDIRHLRIGYKDNDASVMTGDKLIATVYNEIAIDRWRNSCFFANNAVNFNDAIESYSKMRSVFEDLFYDLGYEDTTPSEFGAYTTSPGEVEMADEGFFTEAAEELALTTDWEAEASAPAEGMVTDVPEEVAAAITEYEEQVTTSATTTSPKPDFKCCGRGFTGVAYNAAISKCCLNTGEGALGALIPRPVIVDGYWCPKEQESGV